MGREEKVVAVSGGFDPLHVGHVRFFKEARALGDRLVVILNNDHWLQNKKGYVFMPQQERKEVLLALEPVDEVIISGHCQDPEDMSVCSDLKELEPYIFANGGDRKKAGCFEEGDVPEYEVCQRLGIELKFGVGGDKVQSSSWLIEKVVEKLESQSRHCH